MLENSLKIHSARISDRFLVGQAMWRSCWFKFIFDSKLSMLRTSGQRHDNSTAARNTLLPESSKGTGPYVSTIEWNISPWIQLNTFAIERDIIGRSCLRFSFFFFLSWSSTWYTTRIWMYIPHSSEVIYDFFIFMTRWAVLEFAFSSRFLTFQLLWILAGKILDSSTHDFSRTNTD